MAGGEATSSGFRARAGTLTLFFMTSEESRDGVLYLLERALYGGLLSAMDSDLLEEEPPDDYDYGDEEDELDDDLDEDEDDDIPEPRFRATSKGQQALAAALLLERWLRKCPEGPLRIGPNGGEAIASLVCCWSATVIHALAREPLTLDELDLAVDAIDDRDTVAEHVEAMERVGHVTAQTEDGETRYVLTDWLREGIAPLAAAARMELNYPEEDVAPPDILDVEAAFQLTLPLLELPPDLRGSCRLGVQIPGGPPLMAGATAQIDGGCVVTSSALLEEEPENWATGTPSDWLDTLLDPSAARIKVGGDTRLAEALIESLHETLFEQPQRK